MWKKIAEWRKEEDFVVFVTLNLSESNKDIVSSSVGNADNYILVVQHESHPVVLTEYR